MVLCTAVFLLGMDLTSQADTQLQSYTSRRISGGEAASFAGPDRAASWVGLTPVVVTVGNSLFLNGQTCVLRASGMDDHPCEAEPSW